MNLKRPKLKHIILKRIAIFISSDSLPTLLTAAVAIAIDCGDTILAVTPPATLAADPS
jgi:hypothetical protein